MLAIRAVACRVLIAYPDAARAKQVQRLPPEARFLQLAPQEMKHDILDETKGKGVDVKIIACSVDAVQAQGMALLAKRGRGFGQQPNS